MREPTLNTRIASPKDGVLIAVANRACEGLEDPVAEWDRILKLAVGSTWASLIEAHDGMRTEWLYRKARRRADRSRCLYRDAHGFKTAKGYDGALERDRFARAHLDYVIRRNTRPMIQMKEARLTDAQTFLAKHGLETVT